VTAPNTIKERAVAELRRPVDVEEYARIRKLWKEHSIAEDGRNIPGLLATLTEDCVYEVPATGHRWEGHQGARRFYETLLAAFPDATFDLEHIVIGPQGVYQEAVMSGTLTRDWIGVKAHGQKVAYRVLILFPWDPVRRLFTGERVHFDEATFARQAGMSIPRV